MCWRLEKPGGIRCKSLVLKHLHAFQAAIYTTRKVPTLMELVGDCCSWTLFDNGADDLAAMERAVEAAVFTIGPIIPQNKVLVGTHDDHLFA